MAMWVQLALGHPPLGALCLFFSLHGTLPDPGSAGPPHGTCVLEVAGDTRARLCFLSHVPLGALMGLLTLLGSLPPSTQITRGRQGRCSLYCREGT